MYGTGCGTGMRRESEQLRGGDAEGHVWRGRRAAAAVRVPRGGGGEGRRVEARGGEGRGGEGRRLLSRRRRRELRVCVSVPLQHGGLRMCGGPVQGGAGGAQRAGAGGRSRERARWMAICQAVGCPGIPGSGSGSQIGTLAIKRSSYLWARTSLILKYELLQRSLAWRPPCVQEECG